MSVQPAMVQVQNREQARKHVPSAAAKEKLCLHSSPSLERCRMSRPVRIVMVPVVKDKCPDCRGTGYIARKRKIQVTIPAGIDNGQSVRIREKGEPGVNGGPRGDLLVEVVVSRHPIFQRQDMNIYSTAPVTFAQAALGGEIRINTVDGDVLYEVKPGTQTDTKIRLKGKGSYVKYAANGQYRLLSGVIAPSSQFSSGIMAKITVYGDNDTVLYTSQDIHYNEKLMYFGVDVTGQNEIRVEVSLVTDNEWDDPIILIDGLSLYK